MTCKYLTYNEDTCAGMCIFAGEPCDGSYEDVGGLPCYDDEDD